MAISFDVTAESAQTRNEAINSSNFATNGRQFRIWSWMTDTSKPGATAIPMRTEYNSNALYDLDVTCTNGNWATDASYGQFYWPRPKYRVDCYAAYPKTANFNPSTKVFDYTGSSRIDGDADIMYATFTGQRESRDLSEKSRAVQLSFNHILSQVQFKANKANELTVTITSLEICNIYRQGLFTVGVIGTDTPSWGSLTDIASYSLPLKSTSISLTAEAQSLNAADGMLMLIPQVHTKWNIAQTIAVNDGASGAKGTYLKIGCTIMMDGNPYHDEGYVYFPLDINWEAGKNYTYTLGFGTGYKANGEKLLTDIILSATVTDWVAGTSESESDITI